MKLRVVLLALVLVSCGTQRQEQSSVKNDSSPTAKKWESDPNLTKRNSVNGEVTSSGKAVVGASVTVVHSGAAVATDETGTYVVVLDPDELGTETHELVFAAPGYATERREVTIPRNKRVRLDVELKPAQR